MIELYIFSTLILTAWSGWAIYKLRDEIAESPKQLIMAPLLYLFIIGIEVDHGIRASDWWFGILMNLFLPPLVLFGFRLQIWYDTHPIVVARREAKERAERALTEPPPPPPPPPRPPPPPPPKPAPVYPRPYNFDIPTETRFQHEWIVAPTGSGKTQLIQNQVLADLDRDCTVIVIDSQPMEKGKLLSNIARLKRFAPGEKDYGRLILLQPDPEHSPALNLFDMGQNDPLLPERERQILQSSALQQITFCLGSATDQQQDMLEYLVQLAMQVPNATIDTVRYMLQVSKDQFFKDYAGPLSRVDEVVRDYFVHNFHGKGASVIQVTKDGVMRRILGMLKNPVFRQMFQNERSRFDMKNEVDQGKVILICTDVKLLGEDACQFFGRFFLSLILLATEQRTSKLPVFCYIDECHDYIANEPKIERMLDKARKQSVGVVLAHQRLHNIKSASVLDALQNTAINFAGGNRTDAHTLGKLMHIYPDTIADAPELTFASFVRSRTPRTSMIALQHGVLEAQPQMDGDEYWQMIEDMNRRYGVTRATSPSQERKPPDEDDGVLH